MKLIKTNFYYESLMYLPIFFGIKLEQVRRVIKTLQIILN